VREPAVASDDAQVPSVDPQFVVADNDPTRDRRMARQVLSAGLYRLRITVQADSAQLALERARALVTAAAARAQRPLYPEADGDVRVTPTPRS
jgi:hypothetical protein